MEKKEEKTYLNNSRVAMPLIDSGVCSKEIKIFLAFHIPHVDPMATIQHDRKRVVVVGTSGLFLKN